MRRCKSEGTVGKDIESEGTVGEDIESEGVKGEGKGN